MSTDPIRPRFETINPATLESGRAYDGHTADDAAAIVERCATAFREWRRSDFAARSERMRSAAAVLKRRRAEFAALMTDEMGKTVTDGLAEVDKCATACEHFADQAASYLAREPVDIDGPEAFVSLQPARRRARGDAVELSVLAGVPVRSADPDGRQRRVAEARQQRARLRARHRVGVPRRRLSGRPVPAPCWSRAMRSTA
jgi:hypothetical protein